MKYVIFYLVFSVIGGEPTDIITVEHSRYETYAECAPHLDLTWESTVKFATEALTAHPEISGALTLVGVRCTDTTPTLEETTVD